MGHKNDYTTYIQYAQNKRRWDRKLHLFTICHPDKKHYVSVEELKPVLQALTDEFGLILHCRVERHGKYKQLHAHGLIRLPEGVHYTLYNRVDDLFIHYQWLQSYGSGKRYCDKHYNPYNNAMHDTLMANYYAHHYGFKKWSKKE